MRTLVATSICAIVAASTLGCGESEVRLAPPQVITIGTDELDGRGGVGFRLQVASLRLTANRWYVRATVTNATPVTWFISQPHVRNGTKFGLFVLTSGRRHEMERQFALQRTTPALIADRFQPPLSRRFEPGKRWAGVFSGPGGVPSGRFVRFAFGRFTTYGKAPDGLPNRLMSVTDRVVKVV